MSQHHAVSQHLSPGQSAVEAGHRSSMASSPTQLLEFPSWAGIQTSQKNALVWRCSNSQEWQWSTGWSICPHENWERRHPGMQFQDALQLQFLFCFFCFFLGLKFTQGGRFFPFLQCTLSLHCSKLSGWWLLDFLCVHLTIFKIEVNFLSKQWLSPQCRYEFCCKEFKKK